LLVITQHAAEPNREFRARVQERLERLERKSAPVDQAMVVVGATNDASALPSRVHTLCSLLVMLSTEVQVVLDTGEQRNLVGQRRMRAPADTAAEQAGSPASRIQLASVRATPAVS
jgi:hypothetical protein